MPQFANLGLMSLSLKAAKVATRNADRASAVLAATGTLLLLTVVGGTIYAGALELLQRGYSQSVAVLVLMVFAAVLLLAFFFAAIGAVFASMHLMVSALSLAASLVLLLSGLSFVARLPNADPRYAFGAVVFIGCSQIFWFRAYTSWRLSKNDRLMASPFDPENTVRMNLMQPLPRWYGFRRRSASAIAAAAMISIGRLLQGFAVMFAIMGITFAFILASMGFAFLFDLAMWRFDAWSGDGVGVMVLAASAANGALFIAVAWIFSRLAVLAKVAAQRFSIVGYEEIRALDHRPPILFLRAFKDMQVTIRRSTFLNRLFRCEPTKQMLDHILVERFSRYGPVIALGPDQAHFGAACELSDNDMWQSLVITRATEARAIALVVERTNGVEWEINEMMKSSFVDKTIFMAPPGAFALGLVEQKVIGGETATSVSEEQRVVGAFRRGREWIFLRSDELSVDEYVLGLRTFFRRNHLVQS
jgi:hypothetical protein